MKRVLVTVGVVLMGQALIAAEPESVPRRPPQLPQVVSPEIRPDGTVTFRVRAPNATNVTVSGEWPEGTRPMTKGEEGVWSVTVGPLPPDLYGYGFSVDGFRTLDPGNPSMKPMRSPTTSILDLPGVKPLLHDFRPVPHGTVRLHDYDSKSLGKRRALRVYTPPGYDTHTHTLYPVLYLFHGSGDNEATWTALGRAHVIVDNLLAEHKARPMIVVMPDGHAARPQLAGTNSEARTHAMAAFEHDLIEDVMPFVEKNYRIKNGREHRAIIGLSMGGGQSLTIGLNHLERFAWVGGMSSAVFNPEMAIAAALKNPTMTNKRLDLLWFACGSSDFLIQRNQEFDELLTRHGIKHEFRQTDGNHSWLVWRRYLAEFVPLLFLKK